MIAGADGEGGVLRFFDLARPSDRKKGNHR
jgi:hypothetical protein